MPYKNYDDDLENDEESLNLSSSTSSKGVKPSSYVELLRAGRKNFTPDGFNFDVDMFENLCDCWTPKSSFPLLLNTDSRQLDRFCRIVYNVDFDAAYQILTGVADMSSRKAFKALAFNGNNTAIKVVAEHFMGLSEQQNNQPNITIINDIKKDKQD